MVENAERDGKSKARVLSNQLRSKYVAQCELFRQLFTGRFSQQQCINHEGGCFGQVFIELVDPVKDTQANPHRVQAARLCGFAAKPVCGPRGYSGAASLFRTAVCLNLDTRLWANGKQ